VPAGQLSRIRCRSSAKPGRPYICRFKSLNLLSSPGRVHPGHPQHQGTEWRGSGWAARSSRVGPVASDELRVPQRAEQARSGVPGGDPERGLRLRVLGARAELVREVAEHAA
jgi:hypothetical protein